MLTKPFFLGLVFFPNRRSILNIICEFLIPNQLTDEKRIHAVHFVRNIISVHIALCMLINMIRPACLPCDIVYVVRLLDNGEARHFQNSAHAKLVGGVARNLEVSRVTPRLAPAVLHKPVRSLSLQVRAVSHSEDTVINVTLLAARVIIQNAVLVKLKDKLVGLDSNANGLKGNGRQERTFVARRHVDEGLDNASGNIRAVGEALVALDGVVRVIVFGTEAALWCTRVLKVR